jgi:hypothetical protein
LTSIIIPSSVTNIGDKAFALNPLLETVIFCGDYITPGSDFIFSDCIVSQINVFSQTKNWTDTIWSNVKINIIDLTLTNIDNNNYSIDGCNTPIPSTFIIPFVIGNYNITKISDNTFENKSLTNIIITSSITFIGNYAFANNLLENITISDTVTHIGDYAFANNLLVNIIIPNSVTHIGDYAFANNLLVNIIIPDSVIYIGKHAFTNNKITNIIIPNKITIINDYTFANNDLLNITISESVLIIGNYAFANNKLQNIIIPIIMCSLQNLFSTECVP